MDTLQAIKSRRSIKHFDPKHVMPKEEINQLLSLAVLSPTAFNIQNWRFVVVDDPAQRQKIREVSWDQAQVTDTSLFIILCADIKSWEKDPHRYWAGAPPGSPGFPRSPQSTSITTAESRSRETKLCDPAA